MRPARSARYGAPRCQESRRLSERDTLLVSASDMSWNNANFRLQAALTHDPALAGQQLGDDGTWLVVVEPSCVLNAASLAEIENAHRIHSIEIVQGVTPKVELERARDAV